MTEELHVIVGAGAVGSAVARELLSRGAMVRVLTRTGGGLDDPRVERIAVDAADELALVRLTTGAGVIYNCANPPYHRWAEEWPPIAAALLRAAKRSGAVLATVSNLYGYGPVTGPMTEDLPLGATGVKGRVRAQMWLDALAAHESGEIRATEVRGSDYLGKGAQSHLGAQVLTALRAGKTVRVLGDPDVLHSWTYTGDAARALVAAATDPKGWGRAWHVPSNPARTLRDVVADLVRIESLPTPTIARVPAGMVWAMGLFVPFFREVPEVAHQHAGPWVLDSSAAQDILGLAPTPWDTVLRDHLS